MLWGFHIHCTHTILFHIHKLAYILDMFKPYTCLYCICRGRGGGLAHIHILTYMLYSYIYIYIYSIHLLSVAYYKFIPYSIHAFEGCVLYTTVCMHHGVRHGFKLGGGGQNLLKVSRSLILIYIKLSKILIHAFTY